MMSPPVRGHYTHVIHLAVAVSAAKSMTDPDKYERVNYEGSHKVPSVKMRTSPAFTLTFP